MWVEAEFFRYVFAHDRFQPNIAVTKLEPQRYRALMFDDFHQFIEHASTVDYLRQKHGLTAENAVAKVKSQFNAAPLPSAPSEQPKPRLA